MSRHVRSIARLGDMETGARALSRVVVVLRSGIGILCGTTRTTGKSVHLCQTGAFATPSHAPSTVQCQRGVRGAIAQNPVVVVLRLELGPN